LGLKPEQRKSVDSAIGHAVARGRLRKHPTYPGYYYVPEHEDQIVFPKT
jgi:hypothetical protein